MSSIKVVDNCLFFHSLLHPVVTKPQLATIYSVRSMTGFLGFKYFWVKSLSDLFFLVSSICGLCLCYLFSLSICGLAPYLIRCFSIMFFCGLTPCLTCFVLFVSWVCGLSLLSGMFTYFQVFTWLVCYCLIYFLLSSLLWLDFSVSNICGLFLYLICFLSFKCLYQVLLSDLFSFYQVLVG